MNKIIEELDYHTLDHQELANQVGLADSYIFQLIDTLMEDGDNEENEIAIQMLSSIGRTLHQLRGAYYGRILYTDGTWKYGDKVEPNDMKQLLQIEKDIKNGEDNESTNQSNCS